MCQVKVNVLTCAYIDFYCHIGLWKGYLLSFIAFYHLFVFFNNTNTVSAEMWVWGFANHVWYKSLIKSLVFNSWLETFVSLVISKTPYYISYSQYFHIGHTSKRKNLCSSIWDMLLDDYSRVVEQVLMDKRSAEAQNDTLSRNKPKPSKPFFSHSSSELWYFAMKKPSFLPKQVKLGLNSFWHWNVRRQVFKEKGLTAHDITHRPGLPVNIFWW